MYYGVVKSTKPTVKEAAKELSNIFNKHLATLPAEERERRKKDVSTFIGSGSVSNFSLLRGRAGCA